MPKNIVICCDGTNNEVAGNQTNVLRLFRMLVQDDRQVAYYDAGIGTHADPTAHQPVRRRIYKKLDAAVGLGVRDNVLDAYRYLMHNYGEGDQVYLFGFSRGAYTVRALAAMLRCCGLLRPGHDNLAAYAWAVFTNADGSENESVKFAGAARIKKVFGRDIGVHMVGVWDTVSSFGWIWDLQYIPYTASNDAIAYVRHALAIDERRACFRPNHFWPPEEQDELSVWFAGVHADVGGGYSEDQGGLSKISLEWMMGEAVHLGLRIDHAKADDQLNRIGDNDGEPECSQMHDESKKLGWRLLGVLPKRGYSSDKGGMRWWWPNHAKVRPIKDGAEIHESVSKRTECKGISYQPQLPSEHIVVASQDWRSDDPYRDVQPHAASDSAE